MKEESRLSSVFDATGSRLPVHSPKEERKFRGHSGDVHLDSWREKLRIADAKLMGLERELDGLLHWANVLREKRTELGQYLNYLSTEGTYEGGRETIDEYLRLGQKSRALEEMIKDLKGECATSRSECDYFLSKIRNLSPKPNALSIFKRKSLHTQDSLPYGGPESGFTDPLAVAERIIGAEHTATSVSAVVGAFGAGITYTTLFSATRGRLDLISWAFTCFILVIMSCAAFQIFALPKHGQITRILRMEYLGSAEHRLYSYVLLVGLPMVSGFVLLALSVALLDADSQTTVSGSHLAIRAAGYLPIGFLGYFVISMATIALVAVTIRILSWYDFLRGPMEQLPPEARKDYPSLLFTVKDKLFFLPGGKGYPLYRKQRLERLRREGRS